MLNEKETLEILNEGSVKIQKEEMLVIRNLMTTLAEIEYLCFVEKGGFNEGGMLQESIN